MTALIHIVKNIKKSCFSGIVGSTSRLMTGVILVVGDMFEIVGRFDNQSCAFRKVKLLLVFLFIMNECAICYSAQFAN